MNVEKERVDFELWWLDLTNPDSCTHMCSTIRSVDADGNLGGYINPATHYAWQAWLAKASMSKCKKACGGCSGGGCGRG